MTFFAVTFGILIAAIAIGIAVSIIVFVPLTIYIIPYCLWVGVQNNKGNYLNLQDRSCFRMARNATSLYRSWISHTAPVFR